MKSRKSIAIVCAAVLLAAVCVLIILLLGPCAKKEGTPIGSEAGNTPEAGTEAGVEAGTDAPATDVVVVPTASPEPTAAPTESVTEEPTAEPLPSSEEPLDETPAPTDSPAPIPITVTMRSNDGFVKANSKGTYGVASDGSVRFMGRSVSGQHFISGWKNVVDLECNESTTAALKRDGHVLMTGSQKSKFSAASEWTGIVDIAMGDGHLVGLRTNGTLVSCGDDSKGQRQLSGVSGVIKVVCAGDYTAALKNDGTVFVTNSKLKNGVSGIGNAADIAASKDRLVLLLSNGTVCVIKTDSGEPQNYYRGWSGIVKVFAGEGAVYAIDRTGRLYSDSSMINKEVKDACYVAASSVHAVILRSNGKCIAFGQNKDMQGNVSGWRLLPYISDDGWLLGYGPGSYIGSTAVHTGLKATYSDPATGASRQVTCVVLGDVNGDGAIDNKDVSAVKAHISGDKKLKGAYLRAANIIKDSAKPDSVDRVDLEKLTLEAEGKHVIDQYAKTDKYTAPLASAKRKNKDALGYITISNTNISYPIMYDREWYYNDHDIDRKSATRGSIYFYYGAASGNIVITGHNSRNSGTMFHQLHKVQNNASSLKSYSNRLWAINTYGQTGYWEVWAMYEEGAFSDPSKSSQMYNTCWPGGFDSKSESEKQAWIDYQQKKSALGYTVHVTTQDRFMTLLTCGDDHAAANKGARLYFFLRWVGND